MLRAGSRLARQTQFGGIEAHCGRDDLVVDDVVVSDLTSGAASQDMRARKHLPQFAVSRAAAQRLARAEKKHELGRAVSFGGTPAGRFAPAQLFRVHPDHPCKVEGIWGDYLEKRLKIRLSRVGEN